MSKIVKLPIVLVLISFLWQGTLSAAEVDVDSLRFSLVKRLKALPGTIVKEIEPSPPFLAACEVWIKQPLDHSNPGGEKIWQRLFLSHRGFDRPMVFETDGYAVAWPKTREIAGLIKGNQLIAEHRYFGVSKPDTPNWSFLTVRQAAADHHRLVQLFKGIYQGPWVSTGRSKGGMAALFHKAFYPEDVQAAIAFVAPIMRGLDDPRFLQFLSKQSDDACRRRIEQFQIAVLKNRASILDLLKNDVESGGERYPVGMDSLLEYMVVQYPYSFWQGNRIQCSDIVSSDASHDTLYHHLCEVVSPSSFSSATMAREAALVYQCATELGYHGFPTAHLREWLSAMPEPRYSIFSPAGPDSPFDSEPMKTVSAFLTEQGNNIIYLYGENDPWTACAVEPGNRTNAIRIIVRNTSHKFGLNNLSESDRQAVFETLNEWLGLDLSP